MKNDGREANQEGGKETNEREKKSKHRREGSTGVYTRHTHTSKECDTVQHYLKKLYSAQRNIGQVRRFNGTRKVGEVMTLL